ncbi:hypothetical protein [Agaribacterium sp. ZY112]|uniref:hypothetical protein n=1 Tax=Agaribacterium sp. ZY112 TaxID=3233574 RepID=UPI0035269B8F
MIKNKKEIGLAILACAFLYPITSHSAGFASAIALPEWLALWINDTDQSWLGMQFWNLMTIYPSLAIPIVIVVSCICSATQVKWLYFCSSMAAIYVAYFCANFVLTLLEYPQYLQLNGIKVLIPSIVILGTIFATGYLHNKVVNPTSTA